MGILWSMGRLGTPEFENVSLQETYEAIRRHCFGSMNMTIEQRSKEFFEALNVYLMHEFNYKKPPAIINNNGTISVFRSKCDIYLRTQYFNKYAHDDFPGNIIIISRIGFSRIRMGHGKRLLRFIATKAQILGYSYVGMEQCNPDATAFAERYGFEVAFGCNYVVSVDRLVQETR